MTNATSAVGLPAAFSMAARADAARYALLRRLAPSMRHHLVVNLQPIGMIYEVLERRLRAPAPDLAQVHESVQKINGFAKAALSSCHDVVSWLAPDASATTSAAEGVRECVDLLATSLSFRGYAVRNETGTVVGEVERAAIRNVLTAALVHATDIRPPPAEVSITAQGESAGLRITLALRANSGSEGFANEATYRQLEWDDVLALAGAESAQVEREGDLLHILFPWAPAGRAG